MHCRACDVILSEAEDRTKYSNSGEFIGLCTRCLGWLPNSVGVVGVDPTSYMDSEESSVDVEDNAYDEDLV